jgi:3-oxoacyl-[acyl-carrier protein] reductase
MPYKAVAIVTRASQGIGRATAVRLARDFQAVVLTARQEDELTKTATEVKAAGAEPLIYALDLRERSSVEIIVQGTLDRFGRIDALLNIARAVSQIDLFEMTEAQWEDGMALKLHGARRPDGLSGFQRSALADWGFCPDGWRRNQRYLECGRDAGNDWEQTHAGACVS